MKKILVAITGLLFVALSVLAIGSPASAAGSDGPTPYTVNKDGITLPAGQTFKDNGHVNIKFKANGGSEQSKGIHFESRNNQPGGVWIGKSNIPWSGFGLSGKFCVTWVQISDYNEHFGEGGQAPFCVGNDTPAEDTKSVTLCHFEGTTGAKTTVPATTWFSTHKGHSKDIWEGFTYKNVDGDTKTVPSQGDTSLLQFPNCAKPVDDEKVTPAITKVDKCEDENDNVALVPGRGYTGGVTKNGLVYTVTANVSTGFVFDASKMTDWTLNNTKTTATKTVTLTNEDCDLPETGGKATYNTGLAIGAGAAAVVLLSIAGGVAIARKRP